MLDLEKAGEVGQAGKAGVLSAVPIRAAPGGCPKLLPAAVRPRRPVGMPVRGACPGRLSDASARGIRPGPFDIDLCALNHSNLQRVCYMVPASSRCRNTIGRRPSGDRAETIKQAATNAAATMQAAGPIDPCRCYKDRCYRAAVTGPLRSGPGFAALPGPRIVTLPGPRNGSHIGFSIRFPIRVSNPVSTLGATAGRRSGRRME